MWKRYFYLKGRKLESLLVYVCVELKCEFKIKVYIEVHSFLLDCMTSLFPFNNSISNCQRAFPYMLYQLFSPFNGNKLCKSPEISNFRETSNSLLNKKNVIFYSSVHIFIVSLSISSILNDIGSRRTGPIIRMHLP